MQSFANEAVGGLIWLGLMHSLWIGLLAAAGVALIFQAGFRLSHRSRHAILGAAMIAVALGPVIVAGLQHIIGFLPSGGSSTRVESAIRCDHGQVLGRDQMPLIERVGSATTCERSEPDSASPIPDHRLIRGGRIRAREFGRSGSPSGYWALPSWPSSWPSAPGACDGSAEERNPPAVSVQEKTRRLARRLRLRRIPRVLTHPEVAEPFLCGILRPVIVLPAYVAGVRPARPARCDPGPRAGPCPAARPDGQPAPAVGGDRALLPSGRSLAVAIAEERARALHRRTGGPPHRRSAGSRPGPGIGRTSPSQSPVSRTDADRRHVTGRSDRIPSASYSGVDRHDANPSPTSQFWPLAALPLAAILALVVTAAGLAEDRPSAPADLPTTAVPTKPTTDRGSIATMRRSVTASNPIVS